MLPPPPNTILEHALFYRSLGWNVFPMARGEKRPLKKDKVGDYRHTPIELGLLKKRLTEKPERNIGVFLGPSSGGLAVRDFDEEESYREWAANWQLWAGRLPTVLTRRGAHVYFMCDVERMHRLAGSVKTQVKFPDGEIKYNGAYTALPPSRRFEVPRKPFSCAAFWFEDHDTPLGGQAWEWAGGMDSLKDIPSVNPDEIGLTPAGWAGKRDWTNKEGLDGQERKSVPPCIRICSSGESEDHKTWQGFQAAGDLTEVAVKMLWDHLPSSVGQRNANLFQFARRLKMADWRGSLEDLKPHVMAWHRKGQSLGVISLESGSPETSWEDFIRGWHNCTIIRTGVLEQLAQEAIFASSHLPVPEELETWKTHSNGRRYRPVTDREVFTLGHYCRLLAQYGGKDGFILPAEQTSGRLGINPTRIKFGIRKLLEIGVLKQISAHSHQARRARGFKFNHQNTLITPPIS